MSKYKLKKVSIKKGQSSNVMVGLTTESDSIFFMSSNLEDLIKDPNMYSISIGGRVLIYNDMTDFIKTSDIIKIVEVSEVLLIFETKTSVYKLEVASE